MKELRELVHLFACAFLFYFAAFMVIPSITDITMEALCPGRVQCSLAVYLSGLQQVITGLGTLIVTPLIGNLSDRYGRKALLTLPMIIAIIPLAILAYDRSRAYFYAYYVIKMFTGMFCEGSMQCLSLAYVVSATVAVIAAAYMRLFLVETDRGAAGGGEEEEEASLPLCSSSSSDSGSSPKLPALRKFPSLEDMIGLLRSSLTLSRAAVVVFFNSFAESGVQCALLYFLKAQFQFSKDQFADLLLIGGIAGAFSQLVLMHLLIPTLDEEKLLNIGLLASCAHIFLYSIAWSYWVPYLAAIFILLSVFIQPCIRSIISKKVGPSEQGMAQGCITGIGSFATIMSPLLFTPLTAWFLSEDAPFKFKGFSIMCAGFASLIAFMLSIMMRAAPPTTSQKLVNAVYVQA
ncbi:uncharacterized protein [Elaeis guineensis]|uniref:Hippocampus abundant transcript-like protein 1 isoform X1 n=1 Tax=Elaeis guineensis var. tenera TaxID=51953 RepID=A0A6I9R1R2_ELAGV|nr:hippocampus abundant transcript-like protein 1 isoform X1 [Elaeis guineensis]